MIRSTWEKLIADCQEYKRRVRLPLTNPATNRKDPDKILRASWEHFADFCGETGPDLSRLLLDYRAWIDAGGRIAQGGKGKRKATAKTTDGDGGRNFDDDGDGWDTKKIECCEELARLANFVRSELATSEFWGGNLSLKSSFIQKQNFDGYAFKEKQETEVTGGATIKVQFSDAGTVDPFG